MGKEEKNDTDSDSDDWVKNSKKFWKIHSKKYHGGVTGFLSLCSAATAFFIEYKISSFGQEFWNFQWKEQYPEEFRIFVFAGGVFIVTGILYTIAFFKTKRDMGGFEPPHSSM